MEDEEQGKSTLTRYRKLINKEFPAPKPEPPALKEAPPLTKKSSGAGQTKEQPSPGGSE
jgi:hypothetical protein